MQKKGIEKKIIPRRKNKVYKIKQIDINSLQEDVQRFTQSAKLIALLPSWDMFCQYCKKIIEIEFPHKQHLIQSLFSDDQNETSNQELLNL